MEQRRLARDGIYYANEMQIRIMSIESHERWLRQTKYLPHVVQISIDYLVRRLKKDRLRIKTIYNELSHILKRMHELENPGKKCPIYNKFTYDICDDIRLTMRRKYKVYMSSTPPLVGLV